MMPEQIMAELASPEINSAEVANSGQHDTMSDITLNTFSSETTFGNKTANSSAGTENARVCIWKSFQSPGVSHNRMSSDKERASPAEQSKLSAEASENEKTSNEEIYHHTRKTVLQAKKRQTGCESSVVAKRKKVVKANCMLSVNEHEENSGIFESSSNAIDACQTDSANKFSKSADEGPNSGELCEFLCLNGVATQVAECIISDEFSKGSGSTPSIFTDNTSKEEDASDGDANDGDNEESVVDNCSSLMYRDSGHEENKTTNCNQISSYSGGSIVGSLEEVEDDDFLVPLVSRRTSKRLRRNSIQLFRKSIDATLDCDFINEKQSGVGVCGMNDNPHENENVSSQHTNLCDSNANLSLAPISDKPGTLADSIATTQPKQVPRVRKRKNLTHRKCHGLSDEVGLENVSNPTTALAVNSEPTTINDDVLSDASSQLAEPSAAVSTGRPQRRCSTQPVLYVAPAFPTSKRRKAAEPSVEDIYCNRLWRSQMPKERTWESIPETPIVDSRNGTERLFTTRKHHCAMKFEDGPNQTRLRQRRQKALARGWKPLTKKRLAALDNLLAAKLENFEDVANSP